MVVPSLEIQESWKLPPYFSIYTAVCTITALMWTNTHCEHRTFLLLTDSLSGVLAVQNRIPDIAVYMIQVQLKKLVQKNQNITIAWIPGHKGIPGNEQADRLAKQALNIRSYPFSTRRDANKLILQRVKLVARNVE